MYKSFDSDDQKKVPARRKELFIGGLEYFLKKKLLTSYVWSMALYRAETWVIRCREANYLESFEMWNL